MGRQREFLLPPSKAPEGEPMRKLSLWLFLLASAAAQTAELKPAYDFSLPREERIKLAESAAPAEVSSKDTV